MARGASAPAGGEEDNPYKVLGVSEKATQQEIEQAYRKLARKWHPDKVKNEADKKKSEEMYTKLSSAYYILSDEKRRQEYDQRGTFQGVPFDPDEIAKHFGGGSLFSSLFGGGGAGGGKNRVGFSFTTNGGGPGNFFDMGGSDGFESMMGGMGNQGGRGQAHSAQAQKPKAPTQYKDIDLSLEQLYKGATISQYVNNHHLNLPIKAGLKPGSFITFEGKGQYDATKNTPGDLVFTIKSKPHSTFRLEDRDLITELTVTLKDALEKRDRTFEVIAIDGSKHSINISEGQIIKNGLKHVIQGKGLPATKAGNKSGDLVVIFRIQIPELSNEQRQNIINQL